MKISTILEKIDAYQLFVPAFQREYVWKRDDAKQLIDSLIKEYPTGTMLTWETSKPPELKGKHKYSESQGNIKLLLDGQQRITTLYMLINGEIPPYYQAAEILNDTRGLHVNIETLELSYYMKTRMENNPAWQNITDIFQKKIDAFVIGGEYQKIGKILATEDLQLINEKINLIISIKDREFPEQIIPPSAKINEAIDIFYKVNASGVALTEAELALAQISGYWPQARDIFKNKLNSLKEHGFVFSLDFIIYVLLGCLHHIGSDMRKLHSSDNEKSIKEAWALLDQKILDYVINILRSNAFIDHTDEINSIYALVPIIVFCFDRKGDPLTELEIKKIIKWFYYSQLRTRYISQLPQKLDYDLKVVKDSAQPFDALLNVILADSRAEVIPSEFVGRAVQHPLFSLMRWYFKSKNAVCLSTGVFIRKNMGAKYKLEKDHIFPYSKLKLIGYGQENRLLYSLAQEITNRAILTEVANRTKQATDAAVYLSDIKNKYPTALVLQSIPEDAELWKIENYQLFLQARRELLAEQLTKFLSEITVTGTTTVPMTIEDLIAEGESDGLEFKASLRWDLKNSTINKKLEEVVIKTVAAFGNSSGGTLLIGVEDNGNIIGLENDYSILGNIDKDKFQLHLINLFNQQFGTAYVTGKILIKFHSLDDKEICQVDVSPANEPLVIKVNDKNGQILEKLYARSGNSSQEIPLSEISNYLKDRFHK